MLHFYFEIILVFYYKNKYKKEFSNMNACKNSIQKMSYKLNCFGAEKLISDFRCSGALKGGFSHHFIHRTKLAQDYNKHSTCVTKKWGS